MTSLSRLDQYPNDRIPELHRIQLGAAPYYNSTLVVRPNHHGRGANREDLLDISTRNGHDVTTIYEHEILKTLKANVILVACR